jgi:hypothetical protein
MKLHVRVGYPREVLADMAAFELKLPEGPYSA